MDTGTRTARDPICCKTRRQRLDLLPLTPLTTTTRTQVDKIQCRWSFSLFLVSIIYNEDLPHIYTPTYHQSFGKSPQATGHGQGLLVLLSFYMQSGCFTTPPSSTRRPQPPPRGPQVHTGLCHHVRRTVHSLHHALESAPDFDAASAAVQFQWWVAAGWKQIRAHGRSWDAVGSDTRSCIPPY